MNGEQAETYRIVCDGNVVGGLILQIDHQQAKGELEILFVNPEAHSKLLCLQREKCKHSLKYTL
jgi:hypothetical protein